MTTFEGGPANGKSLLLKRSPILLRVVEDRKGKIDALDLIDDKPEPDETVTVYRIVKRLGASFVDGVKNGKRWGGRFEVARYRINKLQPPIKIARDKEAWQKWAKTQAEKNP